MSRTKAKGKPPGKAAAPTEATGPDPKQNGYVVFPAKNQLYVSKYDISEPIADPMCDPRNPKKLSIQDVTSASYMIKGGVERTPCARATAADSYGVDLYLKKEIMQPTGSFKDRGCRYALLMLNDKQKQNGVIAATGGNHGQGLSSQGMKLNIPVTLVMPRGAPTNKIQKCRACNARVIIDGKDMNESKQIALKLAKDKNLTYINGFDHPHMLAGNGTIGLEIIEDVPELDAVIVPVGGGALIAGIATAIKSVSPKTKIIGVESDKCPSFSQAMKNNSPIFTTVTFGLSDGLALPLVGYNSFYTVQPMIDRVVVVREEWIALAILRLAEEEKCVVEGAGAVGLAALLTGLLNDLKGKKVVVVLSGGNIDTVILGRCLDRGLAADGRLVKFNVEINDRPGGIDGICDIVASLGVTIRDILHDRAWIKDVFLVEYMTYWSFGRSLIFNHNLPFTVPVQMVCETRDWNHSVELKNELRKHYHNVRFSEEPMAIAQVICKK